MKYKGWNWLTLSIRKKKFKTSTASVWFFSSSQQAVFSFLVSLFLPRKSICGVIFPFKKLWWIQKFTWVVICKGTSLTQFFFSSSSLHADVASLEGSFFPGNAFAGSSCIQRNTDRSNISLGCLSVRQTSSILFFSSSKSVRDDSTFLTILFLQGTTYIWGYFPFWGSFVVHAFCPHHYLARFSPGRHLVVMRGRFILGLVWLLRQKQTKSKR